ncbi:Calcium-binding EGF domain family protein [Brugia pahangi]
MDIGLARSVIFKFIFWKSIDGDAKLNAIVKIKSVYGICPIGYQIKDGTCVDINECESSQEICHKHSHCINAIGDYICERNCQPGFKVDSRGDCKDIDECALGMHNCTSGVLCKNIPGAFLCEASLCAEGYIRDSSGHCKDVNECDKLLCGNLKCLNHLGSYNCICPTGFPIDINGICEDINECTFNLPCNYECENIEGSYKCLCPEGYTIEQNNCTDINECLSNPCLTDELCFNQLGSYECLTTPCPVDYHLKDQKCIPNCQNCSNLPIIIYMLSLPKIIPIATSLLRLTAYDHRSRVLHRTRFITKSVSKSTKHIPFIFKTKNGRATLQNVESSLKAGTYKLAIRSISKLPYRAGKLINNSIVFIAVSEYDF